MVAAAAAVEEGVGVGDTNKARGLTRGLFSALRRRKLPGPTAFLQVEVQAHNASCYLNGRDGTHCHFLPEIRAVERVHKWQKQLPDPIKSSVDDQFPPNGRSAPFCISYCGTFHRASILGLSMAVREEAIGERFIRAKATVAWALSTFAVWKPGAREGKWGGKQSEVDWGRRTRPTFAPSSGGVITPLSRSRAFGCCQRGRERRAKIQARES